MQVAIQNTTLIPLPSTSVNGSASSGVRERLSAPAVLPVHPWGPSRAGPGVWAAAAPLCLSAVVGGHGCHDGHLSLRFQPAMQLQQGEVSE